MIPRYAMLDIWMALYGTDHSEEFDPWYDQVGYAEAWAFLCAAVREWEDLPAPSLALSQDRGTR